MRVVDGNCGICRYRPRLAGYALCRGCYDWVEGMLRASEAGEGGGDIGGEKAVGGDGHEPDDVVQTKEGKE